jgi:hypothetical protein
MRLAGERGMSVSAALGTYPELHRVFLKKQHRAYAALLGLPRITKDASLFPPWGHSGRRFCCALGSFIAAFW